MTISEGTCFSAASESRVRYLSYEHSALTENYSQFYRSQWECLEINLC
jgi:hypothetical protein